MNLYFYYFRFDMRTNEIILFDVLYYFRYGRIKYKKLIIVNSINFFNYINGT